jgi:hypothetical protein
MATSGPWHSIGFTFYNDPPPGAGNLSWGGYSFAELGTATRAGVATGIGNLGIAMGLNGEEPMGSEWTLFAGHQAVYAKKEDRGYGQGGDGVHSDPRYAIDLYDGAAHGLPNLVAALGAQSSGALWIMRGRWHAPMALPPGAASLAPAGGVIAAAPSASGATHSSVSQHDYHQKVKATGKAAGEHGSSLQRMNTALSGIVGRYRR